MPGARSYAASGLRAAVDATSLLDRPTGVGTFVRELLGGLARTDEVEPVAFAVSWRGRARLRSVAAEVAPGLAVAGRPVPARVARAAWRRADRPTVGTLLGGSIPVDLVHGPNFVVPPGGGAAELVTVHDLTAIRFPELCTPDVLQWPHLLERALRRGAWVHAVSEHVAGEVRARFPAAGERVAAIANGVHPLPPPAPGSDAAEGHRLAGGDRYVLALGTVEPRKELPVLVAAFDELAARDPDLRLVVAGPDGWAAPELTAARDRARHRRRVVRLGWVDATQRVALLRGASVVAYPSRYEGFGLVPLEALVAGTPVVATRAGALPEVLGGLPPEVASLVEPGDADELGAALGAALAGVDRGRLDDAAAQVLERYRWDRTVEEVVALYRRVAADR